jgi:hypothetical protein
MRITQKDLEAVVNRINAVTKSPPTSYTKTKDGKYKANIGNYHLSGAYGGVSLHRMHNSSGGVEDVFSCGHTTKRDLYNRMQSFLLGVSK